jgi:hypothetical protein
MNMKNTFVLICFILGISPAFAQNIWEKTYPVATAKSVGRDLQIGADGTIVIVGEIDFPAPSGSFKHYVRLLKINPNDGAIIWENIVKNGEIALETAYSVRESENGIIYTAGFADFPTTRMYCVQTNALGDTLRTQKVFADVKEVAYVVRFLPNGDYFLAGTRYEPAKVYKLYRFSADGTLIWQKAYALGGSTSADGIIDLEFTTDGNIIFLHSLNNGSINITKITLDGNEIYSQSEQYSNFDIPTALCATPDGGCIVTAVSNGVAGSNPIIVKFDANGTKEWQKPLNYSAHTPYSIELDPDQNGYILGMSGKPSGTTQGKVYFLKIDLNGELVWTKFFEGKYDRFVVVPNPSGGYVGLGTRNETMLLINTDTSNVISNLQDITEKITLYVQPNPCADFFNIYLQNADNEPINYQIFDFLGHKMLEKNIQNSSAKIEINVQEWSTGTYILKAKVGKMNFNKLIEIVK